MPPDFKAAKKGIFKNDKQFLDIIIINHFHIIRNFLGAVVREDSSTIISGGVMVSTTDFGSVGKGSSPFPRTDIKKQISMKQLMHIIFDPLRSSKLSERLVVALALVMIAFGFAVLAIDNIVVYIMSILLLLCVAKLIGEITEDEDV